MPDTTLTSAELLDKLDDLIAKCTDQDAPGSVIYFTIGRLQQLLTGDQHAFSQLRALLFLARAGLEAGKAEEWLPIETLPPEADGTSIIVAAWNGTEYTVAEVTAIAGGFRWLWSGTDPDDDDRWLSDDGFEPTHWRPLPAPPAIRALPLTTEGGDKL